MNAIDTTKTDLQWIRARYHSVKLPSIYGFGERLLAWIAVWPTSMFVSLIVKPTLGRNFPYVLAVGVVTGGIVVILLPVE